MSISVPGQGVTAACLLRSASQTGHLWDCSLFVVDWRGTTTQREMSHVGRRQWSGNADGIKPPGGSSRSGFGTLCETATIARRAFGGRTVRGQVVGLVTVVALLALSAACSGGGHGATATTQPRSESATSSTATAGEQEALDAYRAFWDAYLAAADPMDPLSTRLSDHATGTELETVRTAFIARRSGGEVIRGTVDLAPRVVSIVGDAATVRDCYLDNTGVYDAATGTRKDTATGVRHLITASLVREGTAWKVSDLKREGDGCTAA